MSEEADEIISRYESKVRYKVVQGVKTSLLDDGAGTVVFCIHGVPTSSFLYRKSHYTIKAIRFESDCY